MQQKSLSLLIAALLATSSAFAASEAPEMDAAAAVEATSAKALGEAQFVGSGAASWHAELPAIDEKLGASLKEKRVSEFRQGQPLQVGFARDLEEKAQRINGAALNWQPSASGGLVAHLSVRSPGAEALRVALWAPTKRHAPTRYNGATPDSYEGLAGMLDNVTLRFRGSSEARVFEVSGKQLEIDEANWSPVTIGDTMTIEVELAPGVSPKGFALRVPQVSHLDLHPAASHAAIRAKIGESDYCENDIACRTSAPTGFANTTKAVARMVFTKGGSSYLCSGTLLNNTNSPRKAMFWTAAHCISTSTVASTLQTYWFYDAATCNGSTVNPGYRTLTGGSYLRHANTTRDTALLELKNAPPTGAIYAGWTSSAITSTGGAIEGIHHPAGDVKKYSLGNITALSAYTDGKGPFYQVVWYDGVTEGGSSGSGLFTINSSGNYQLRGGLYGGTSYCNAQSSPDVYSRLSDVWSSVQPYLYP